MVDKRTDATEANGKKVRQKKQKFAPASLPEPKRFASPGTEVRKA